MSLKKEIMSHDCIYSFLYGRFMATYPDNDFTNAIIEIKKKS